MNSRYSPVNNNSYEMSSRQNGNYGSQPNLSDRTAFLQEISSIRDAITTYNQNVNNISNLHTRSLSSQHAGDEQQARRDQQELDRVVDETRGMSMQLRERIKTLEREAGSDLLRKQQTAAVKSKFIEAIQNYQNVEQQFQKRYKQQIERQFKIVKPDATPDEVRAVVNDDGGNAGQIFSQALMSSNRFGESRAAYREVQERHEDVKRIERTLAELAQLFNDMSILVEQQDETINAIQNTAFSVEKDTEAGRQQTEKAVTSARNARRLRWVCFWIILVVIIVVVIAVLLTLKPWQTKKN